MMLSLLVLSLMWFRVFYFGFWLNEFLFVSVKELSERVKLIESFKGGNNLEVE